MAEELPLILSDGTNSYIYGPDGMPIEQISSGGTVTYLHHDQQGSTRLLTGSTGTVTGKCTYGAYGTPTCEGAATTPLGYDGQYTSTDTGLDLPAQPGLRPSDSAVPRVDPLRWSRGRPTTTREDNPLNRGDATGLSSWNRSAKAFGPKATSYPKAHSTHPLLRRRGQQLRKRLRLFCVGSARARGSDCRDRSVRWRRGCR